MIDFSFPRRLAARIVRGSTVAKSAESPPGFTVLSYNVGNGLAPPHRLVDFLFDAEADIVGLQELSASQADAIESKLADTYPHRILIPAGHSGKGFLSRFPVHESSTIDIAPERPDLSVAIELLGRDVQVFVAHPRPPKVRLSGAIFDPVTLNQIQRVAEMALNRGPSIILGDFNMTDRQPEHKYLTAAGLIDAFHEVGGRGPSFPRRVGHPHRFGPRARNVPLRPLIRIDYIWYTREFTALSVGIGADAGSDHLPVLAKIDWRHADQDSRPDL
jgi:vancomycin resistance protein VanJ